MTWPSRSRAVQDGGSWWRKWGERRWNRRPPSAGVAQPGTPPESWIPPEHVVDVRTLGRLYLALMDERRAWLQRIQAQLYHQEVPSLGSLLTDASRTALVAAGVSPAGRQMVATAMAAIDALREQIVPLRSQLRSIGRSQ